MIPAESAAADRISPLRLYCTECGDETLSHNADFRGVCILCITSAVIKPLLAEYRRLWAKRDRYSKTSASLRPVESQLATVARRIGDKVHARISRPDVAIALLNAKLEEARVAAERPRTNSRILIPRTGDMLASHRGVGRELRQLVGA